MKVIHVNFAGGETQPDSVPQDIHQAREQALQEAATWAAGIEAAREGYDLCLRECRRLGISNVAVARAVGKTEAAIRMHFTRKATR